MTISKKKGTHVDVATTKSTREREREFFIYVAVYFSLWPQKIQGTAGLKQTYTVLREACSLEACSLGHTASLTQTKHTP